ncbi:hypothetical protein CEXT_530731 [Caerostris extrusa]|uniref:Uncharacterized protein n=1 Tax=Caerostris extrusa TaxID=172846 RepID=A0AAV4Y2J4_CAEEX|nr:hypothetical protein CEXT_530731 [Caerostris extrusa]
MERRLKSQTHQLNLSEPAFQKNVMIEKTFFVLKEFANLIAFLREMNLFFQESVDCPHSPRQYPDCIKTISDKQKRDFSIEEASANFQ